MTNVNRGNEPRWERIEAGYYSRAVGLNRRLEIVHMNDTVADKLYEDRWVVRLAELKPRVTLRLGRFASKREAKAFADEWRREVGVIDQ